MGLELDSVISIPLPTALGSDPFPRSHGRKGSQDCHGFLSSLHLDLQDAETGLLIVECNPLHLSAQRVIRAAGNRLMIRFFTEWSTAIHGM
jgi:hypothetical protein